MQIQPWRAVLLMLTVMALAGPAHAHKVSIFAWVEGDTVYTQSKFSGGKKARAATVEVFDDLGVRLLSGRTDANGEFSFKVPRQSPLRIVLDTGSGHKNEWTVPLEEITEAGATGTSPQRASPAEPTAETGQAVKKQVPQEPPPLSPAQIKTIEAAVEKVLERKLRPIHRMLAEARDPGPGPTDILGGIGYIIGLVGIGAYVHSRKKES